jgi:hypothetical protein
MPIFLVAAILIAGAMTEIIFDVLSKIALLKRWWNWHQQMA